MGRERGMAKSLETQRNWITRAFNAIEDIVYIGLGVLLAGSSIILLVTGMIDFGRNLVTGDFIQQIVPLLDRILLILLFVELLYTIQVSFREHTIVPEPFLLVGLIAGIRRVLVLTAEGRMSAYVLGGLPLFLFIAISAMSPGYMDPLLEGWGPVVLLACCAWAGLGFAFIMRMVKIEG